MISKLIGCFEVNNSILPERWQSTIYIAVQHKIKNENKFSTINKHLSNQVSK